MDPIERLTLGPKVEAVSSLTPGQQLLLSSTRLVEAYNYIHSNATCWWLQLTHNDWLVADLLLLLCS